MTIFNGLQLPSLGRDLANYPSGCRVCVTPALCSLAAQESLGLVTVQNTVLHSSVGDFWGLLFSPRAVLVSMPQPGAQKDAEVREIFQLSTGQSKVRVET